MARAYGVVTDQRALAQRWTFYIGGDGNILRVDRRVRPSTAGEDVIATLRELGVPKRSERSGRPATRLPTQGRLLPVEAGWQGWQAG